MWVLMSEASPVKIMSTCITRYNPLNFYMEKRIYVAPSAVNACGTAVITHLIGIFHGPLFFRCLLYGVSGDVIQYSAIPRWRYLDASVPSCLNGRLQSRPRLV